MSRLSSPAAARSAARATDDDDGLDMDATHRAHTTVATHGVSKPAGVPASVFEAGMMARRDALKSDAAKSGATKARRQRVPFDAASVKLDDDVPVPVRGGEKGSQFDALAASIQVGQSVALRPSHAKTFVKLCKRAGKRMTVRDMGDGTHRVWRIADKPTGGAQ